MLRFLRCFSPYLSFGRVPCGFMFANAKLNSFQLNYCVRVRACVYVFLCVFSMFLCVCVCGCVDDCVCSLVCMCVCVGRRAFVCVFVCLFMVVYVCVFVHMSVCLCVLHVCLSIPTLCFTFSGVSSLCRSTQGGSKLIGPLDTFVCCGCVCVFVCGYKGKSANLLVYEDVYAMYFVCLCVGVCSRVALRGFVICLSHNLPPSTQPEINHLPIKKCFLGLISLHSPAIFYGTLN